jgi:O-antigen/teichoic acid export membrane protein
MTKETTRSSQIQPDNGLAIVALVLGVVSLTGPGLLLGIPAIIIASIALKRGQGNRGLSLTGLITGIVSTVLSVLFITFILFMVMWGIAHSQDFEQPGHHFMQDEQILNNSRT